jgi:O-acetyl-ADP-ribose deacetylase (regulator of RNase III)
MPGRVSTFVGSIVDPAIGAHAIVNSSNPELGLGSGVSGAIREACGGAAFQIEVRRAWEEEFGEPLEADDCLVTSAGSATAFRWVLHVAAVAYRRRDPETGGSSGPSRVEACTRAALREAARLANEHDLIGSLVLAMPLLGAGHGGLGEIQSAAAMMKAISVFDELRKLGNVRFAVLEPELAPLVVQAAQRFGVSR